VATAAGKAATIATTTAQLQQQTLEQHYKQNPNAYA